MTTTTQAAEGHNNNEWPQTMRAWQYASIPSVGLDKALHLNDMATPPAPVALTPDAVLVRVHYMSVNPADYKVAELRLLALALVSLPASPGMDYSGRVVAAGTNMAAKYRPGDPVFGRVEPSKFGTMAKYVIAKNAEAIAHIPAEMGDEEAALRDFAAVGTCGLTALQTIKPYVKQGSGSDDKVLINGGSGGTGTYGIQMAKALGCHVTVTCSGRNADLCKSLGADEVIDYTQQNVSEVLSAKGKIFALVVDNVGFSPAGQQDLYTAANKFLADEGCFVQVGGGTSKEMIKATFKRALVPGLLGGGKRKWTMALTAQSYEDLETIAGWMKEGKVKSVIDEVVDFQRAPEAYTKLKTGRTKGKIVVKMHE